MYVLDMNILYIYIFVYLCMHIYVHTGIYLLYFLMNTLYIYIKNLKENRNK